MSEPLIYLMWMIKTMIDFFDYFPIFI